MQLIHVTHLKNVQTESRNSSLLEELLNVLFLPQNVDDMIVYAAYSALRMLTHSLTPLAYC